MVSQMNAKCPLTGLPKAFCAHCVSGPLSTTPRYELRESVFKGKPVVEVLKDGGPVHPHDEHFRFGLEKARLLLTVLEPVREFALTTREDRTHSFGSRVVRDQQGARDIKVWVEMHPEFERSSGRTVEQPWLRIEALPIGTGAYIGVGVQKAKAVSALADQLGDWVRRRGGGAVLIE
jgi:hypothetical protein